MMSKVVDVASSTSYTARAILQNSQVARVSILIYREATLICKTSGQIYI